MIVAEASNKCIKMIAVIQSAMILFSGFYSSSLAKSPNPHSSGGSSMFLCKRVPLATNFQSLEHFWPQHKHREQRQMPSHHSECKFCCGFRVKESSLHYPSARHHEVYKIWCYCQCSDELKWQAVLQYKIYDFLLYFLLNYWFVVWFVYGPYTFCSSR